MERLVCASFIVKHPPSRRPMEENGRHWWPRTRRRSGLIELTLYLPIPARYPKLEDRELPRDVTRRLW